MAVKKLISSRGQGRHRESDGGTIIRYRRIIFGSFPSSGSTKNDGEIALKVSSRNSQVAPISDDGVGPIPSDREVGGENIGVHGPVSGVHHDSISAGGHGTRNAKLDGGRRGRVGGISAAHHPQSETLIVVGGAQGKAVIPSYDLHGRSG